MENRFALAPFPGLLAALLAGCATPSLHLFPDEEGGTQGAVAVLESHGRTEETVIGTGGTRTRLGARPATSVLEPGRLNKRPLALLGFLPPKAATFILEFEEDSLVLTPESIVGLQQVKAELRRRSGADLEVIGGLSTGISAHRDAYLSDLWAHAVLEELADQGISRELMTALGQPSAAPMLAQNERVEEAVTRKILLVVR
jgi:outer membrane protein OmpA-like peptidoglycan-associated protein